jgi:hypothetical protein
MTLRSASGSREAKRQTRKLIQPGRYRNYTTGHGVILRLRCRAVSPLSRGELRREKRTRGLTRGILESFGRLFKNSVKLYIYPMRIGAYNRYCLADPTSCPTLGLGISEHPLVMASGSMQQTCKSNCTYAIFTPIFSRITMWSPLSNMILRSWRFLSRYPG